MSQVSIKRIKEESKIESRTKSKAAAVSRYSVRWALGGTRLFMLEATGQVEEVAIVALYIASYHRDD